MAEIELVDVSLRDGNQSLWGANGITTAKALTIAPILDRVGFRAIDFTSSTHMGMAVRNYQEDPWERCRLVHAAMPNTPLQAIGTGFRFISWETQSEEFMQLVYDRMVANGIARHVVLDPMNDAGSIVKSAGMLKKSGASEVMGSLTYTISELHNDAYYADLTEKLVACKDIDRVYIKDPGGILTPDRVITLVPAIAKKLNGKALELHTHCNIGLASINSVLAAERGVSVIHVGCGALGNGTSLPSATPMVKNLRGLGHSVDIDDRLLAQVDNYYNHMADSEGLAVGRPQELDVSFLRHQAAGGYISTTRRQLRELNMEHRFDEVIEETLKVRAELGYPIMVTPFPQMIGTQSTYNLMSKERYTNVPDQIIHYVLGNFGKPIGAIDQNIKDKILALPRAKELAKKESITPLSDLRKRFSPKISDDEFLLRATMPAEQVDAMIKAGPAKRRYNPYIPPVKRLINELKEKSVPFFNVDKNGSTFELSSD